MMIVDYIYRLVEGAKSVTRWQGRIVLHPSSIGEHMHGTALIADIMGQIEKEEFNNEVDELKLLRYSLNHDNMETITTDLPSGIKKKTPLMEEALTELEKIYFNEDFKDILPKKYADRFESMLLNPKENKETIEGKILHFADNFHALLECVIEIKSGNERFTAMLQEIIHTLMETDLDSGKYLLKYGVPNLGLINNYYGIDYINYVKNLKIKNIEI